MSFLPDEKITLRAEDVVWREVADELVVLELTTSTYLTLNGTAKRIWEGLSSGTTVDELVAMVSDHYGVPLDTARSDVESFLEALDERSLLDRAA
jgi:Coenzyme PQQ synthesis protein D (PqqD)